MDFLTHSYKRDHEDKIKTTTWWDPTAHREDTIGYISDVVDVKTEYSNNVILTIEHQNPLGDVKVQICQGDIVYLHIVNHYVDKTTSNNINYKYFSSTADEKSSSNTKSIVMGEVTNIKLKRVRSIEDAGHAVLTIKNIYDSQKTIDILTDNIRFASVISRGNKDTMYKIYCNINYSYDSDKYVLLQLFGVNSKHTFTCPLTDDNYTELEPIRDSFYKLKSKTYFMVPASLPSDIYNAKAYIINKGKENIVDIGKIFVDNESNTFIPYSCIHANEANNEYQFTGITKMDGETSLNKYRSILVDCPNYYDNIMIQTNEDYTHDDEFATLFSISSSIATVIFPLGDVEINSTMMFYNIPYNMAFSLSDNETLLKLCDHDLVKNKFFTAARYDPINFVKDSANGYTDCPNFLLNFDRFMHKNTSLYITITRTKTAGAVINNPEVLRFKFADNEEEHKKPRSYFSNVIESPVIEEYKDCSVLLPCVNTRSTYHIGIVQKGLSTVTKYDYDLTPDILTKYNSQDNERLYGYNKVIPFEIKIDKTTISIPFYTYFISRENEYIISNEEDKSVTFSELYIDEKSDATDLYENKVIFIGIGTHTLIGIDATNQKYVYTDFEINYKGEHNFDMETKFFNPDVEHEPAYAKEGLEIFVVFPDNKNITCTSMSVYISSNKDNEKNILLRSITSGEIYPHTIDVRPLLSLADDIGDTSYSEHLKSDIVMTSYISDIANITNCFTSEKISIPVEDRIIVVDCIVHDDKNEFMEVSSVITKEKINSILPRYDINNKVKKRPVIILMNSEKEELSHKESLNRLDMNEFSNSGVDKYIIE